MKPEENPSANVVDDEANPKKPLCNIDIDYGVRQVIECALQSRELQSRDLDRIVGHCYLGVPVYETGYNSFHAEIYRWLVGNITPPNSIEPSENS